MEKWEVALKKAAKQIPAGINQTEASKLFCEFFKKTRVRKCLLCDNVVKGSLFPCNVPPTAKFKKRILSNRSLSYKIDTIKGFLCARCVAKHKIKDRIRKHIAITENIKPKSYKGWKRYDAPQAAQSPDYVFLFNELEKTVTDDYSQKLREMKYKDFLKTDYWKTVRNYIIHTHKRCKICGGNHRFNVHHKSYENRGYEHLRTDELVLLCQKCHQAIHATI